VLPRGEVTGLDAAAEPLLLVGREEGDLVDLDQVGLEAAFGGNGGTSRWLAVVGPRWSQQEIGPSGARS
jgi:hypothetical protein